MPVHAVLRAGAVVSPLNPALTAGEMAKQLGHAGARAVIVAEPRVDKAYEAIGGTGVDRVYVLGEHPGARPFRELTSAAGAAPAVDLDPSAAPAVHRPAPAV